jgi:hypothetical protein
MTPETPSYCQAFRELVLKLTSGHDASCIWRLTEDEWQAAASGPCTTRQLAWLISQGGDDLETLRQRLRKS